MQLRRLRPVAALSLALIAAPFLAATAVAAQAGADSTTADASPAPRLISVSWLETTTSSVKRVADSFTFAAAETVIPPSPIDPAPPVRATAPKPPDINDKATWIWPADGPITSQYGRRWGRMHEGVDVDAAFGSNVWAAQRGTVVQAGWGQSGYGRVVHIDHGNGVVTTYNHLNSISTTVGAVIEQGTKIGTVGASGSVTAAHLHYEVRINGGAVNPNPWLQGPHSMAGNPG
jgi:murein DD-endopeptidase MepM/ murein hydrolase activator NlpD